MYVSIYDQATSWMTGVLFPAGAGSFSLRHRVLTGSGAHPASYHMGTVSSYPAVKLPAREADSSPLSSTEAKNSWSYTSTPPYLFMAWYLVEHKGSLQFYCIGKCKGT